MTDSDAGRAKERIRRRVAGGLLAVAQLLQKLHRDNLGDPYPPASEVGEFPHRRSGRLRAATDYDPKSLDEVAQTLHARVFYRPDVTYAKFLSRSGRLSIADTAAENRPELAEAFRTGKGAAG